MDSVTITRNDQTVECYGELWEDSNVICCFDNEGFDGIYCGGGANWAEIVEKLTAYAKRCGTTLLELSAC